MLGSATSFLASASDDPTVFDDEVLDQFTIPFGQWMKQTVNWIVLNMEDVLSVIEWPFRTLLDLVVRDFLVPVSWVVVVAMMFVIAWLARNFKVAVGVALALTLCGLLGDSYWIETARTIGYIVVAVVLCVAVGIPVGILCGRSDGAWRVVRPGLDAMQVVHSFVYMLPFIYFWGIGPVPATMVTMIFAIPPLIRLTNLGIRQVPDDVVEASRAFGAPELRVLTDVQIPLARPAIMTGINQTLLLSISMLGIAAIMGAGGLGRLLFQAINNQDTALASSAGLAFFLVAVVLDRISQPESGQGGNLFSRIAAAWKARKDPSQLLVEQELAADEAAGHDEIEEEEEDYIVGTTPALPGERIATFVTMAGAVVALVSVLLPWTENASKISSYSRRTDEFLPGVSSNGLSATGGSWFGIMVVLLAIWVLAAGVNSLIRAGEGPRWLSPDGAVIGSLAMLATAFSFWYASPPDNRLTDEGSLEALVYSNGFGVYVAIIAGVVAAAGALWWMAQAPRVPRTPLKQKISFGRLLGGAVAVGIAVIAVFSAWTYDERQDIVFSPELEAEIQDIRDTVDAGDLDSAVGAAQIGALRNEATVTEAVILDGATGSGSGLGVLSLIYVALGAAAVLPGVGLLGFNDKRQWLASAVSIGLGAGTVGLTVGWIGSLTRASDTNVVSGVGSFLAMLAGLLLAGTSAAIVGGFERTKVYRDDLDQDFDPVQTAPEPELVSQ